jgi:glycosyltransferase involved in cell wall biosynthesis
VGPVRILIWHGYLLAGTGSNVYTRAMARAWSRAGHEVVVVSQEPHPERYDLGGAQTVRPRITGRLPVFVLDKYAESRPQLLTEMSREEREHFVEQNAAALRALGPADLVLANHVLLGGPVAAASGLPHVVKAHGSELEYAMRGNAELCSWAAESLTKASAVVAGSNHIVDVLAELVAPDPDTVHVVPPGVDVELLRPAPRDEALRDLLAQCALDPPNPPDHFDERLPDDGNAERLAAFFADTRPTVLYVGKLSDEKGVGLLVEALERLDARGVIVGFGAKRAELQAAAGPDVLFTGPLEHRHLAHLWPLADVSVTPSVFPEAFGMVAAEAASCGSLPLVARHSGLAEVADGLEAEYPTHLSHLAGFARGDVDDLTARLRELLALSDEDRRALSAAARRAAVRLWAWESVAARVLALGAPDPDVPRA